MRVPSVSRSVPCWEENAGRPLSFLSCNLPFFCCSSGVKLDLESPLHVATTRRELILHNAPSGRYVQVPAVHKKTSGRVGSLVAQRLPTVRVWTAGLI